MSGALALLALSTILVVSGLSQMPFACDARSAMHPDWTFMVTMQGMIVFLDTRWRSEQLTSLARRRLLSAVQAGTLVAMAMTYLEFASAFIDGRRALPWNAIPKGPLEVVTTLGAPRSGLDLYLSPRLAAWALVSAALWFLAVRANTHLAEALHQARLLREAQDSALRGRMAPAVIFSALDTIKAQVKRDPREAAATTDRLASLFRQVVELTERPLVTVREEVAFIETYLGIEKARLGSRLLVKLEILEDVEPVEIPPLSLQILVENAVKHGVAPREEGGEIRIWARWDGEGSFRKLEVGVESPATAMASTAASAVADTLASLRARLERPDDLSTATRNERFLARFIWRGAQAWP
jgi:hypothetical protein